MLKGEAAAQWWLVSSGWSRGDENSRGSKAGGGEVKEQVVGGEAVSFERQSQMQPMHARWVVMCSGEREKRVGPRLEQLSRAAAGGSGQPRLPGHRCVHPS